MGVSVIHQALLAYAPSYREVIARCPLRCIRSSAAALSSKVHAALESTFNVPVLTTYGLTEAMLVSCNPLPPRQRKPGSVGVTVGLEVAIMDAEGKLLPSG
jgi:acyl-coenzyme A synthetase/AMP-(fatty) acid ligase